MNLEAVLNQLLPFIYRTALGGSWDEFLDAFRPHVRAKQSVLTLIDLEGGGVRSRVSTSGISPEAAAEYMGKWVAQDPWVLRAPQVAAPGEVRVSHELCPDSELESLPVYREFLSLQGWHYGAGVVVISSAGLHGILSFSRPKSEGPVEPQEQELLRALQPHISACIELHLRLRHLEGLAATSERLPYGHALIDMQGQVLHANAVARRLLERRRLRPPVTSCYLESEKCWLIARFLEGPPPCTELLFIDPHEPWHVDMDQIRSVFGLTPAEARVVALICGGLSVRESAKRLNISVETGRTHLKRALSKTHTNRQAELVGLVLRLEKSTK